MRFGPRRVLLGVLWGLPPALHRRTRSCPELALSAVAIYFVGLLYLGALSSFTSIAQLRAPAAVRGRVLSVLQVLLGSLYPLGAVLQGAIADAIGLRVDDRRRRAAHAPARCSAPASSGRSSQTPLDAPIAELHGERARQRRGAVDTSARCTRYGPATSDLGEESPWR